MHSASIRRGNTQQEFWKNSRKRKALQKGENAELIILTGEVTREDEGITVLMGACHQVQPNLNLKTLVENTFFNFKECGFSFMVSVCQIWVVFRI